ncbi:hypothetical protein SALBM311S_00077 [Streptomyces alboniger]
MAKQRDIEPLLSRAITAKARSLRPSLKDAKRLEPADTGILLGNLQGTKHEVRMGYEDVAVAIMAPRSGKTTSLAIPSILNAPGPVLLTSNKAAGDAYTATLDARAAVGRTWSMDPQQIAHAERAMWWNPLSDAKTLDGAGRLAGHFLAASVDASQQGDFWSKAGSNILSQLFLAAALAERPITDVMPAGLPCRPDSAGRPAGPRVHPWPSPARGATDRPVPRPRAPAAAREAAPNPSPPAHARP